MLAWLFDFVGHTLLLEFCVLSSYFVTTRWHWSYPSSLSFILNPRTQWSFCMASAEIQVELSFSKLVFTLIDARRCSVCYFWGRAENSFKLLITQQSLKPYIVWTNWVYGYEVGDWMLTGRIQYQPSLALLITKNNWPH